MAKIPLFSPEQEKEIVRSIAEAEKMTSGEIRVHITEKKEKDSMESAVAVFKELKMYKTQARNGVLIHICFGSRTFAIYGDKGIHEKVGDTFWEETKEKMQRQFSKENWVEGIKEGVLSVGEKLKEFFPFNEDDINELSDEIIFD